MSDYDTVRRGLDAYVEDVVPDRDFMEAEGDEWFRALDRIEAREKALREALTQIRDEPVPYPYSPQYLKDIARAALGEQP